MKGSLTLKQLHPVEITVIWEWEERLFFLFAISVCLDLCSHSLLDEFWLHLEGLFCSKNQSGLVSYFCSSGWDWVESYFSTWVSNLSTIAKLLLFQLILLMSSKKIQGSEHFSIISPSFAYLFHLVSFWLYYEQTTVEFSIEIYEVY